MHFGKKMIPGSWNIWHGDSRFCVSACVACTALSSMVETSITARGDTYIRDDIKMKFSTGHVKLHPDWKPPEKRIIHELLMPMTHPNKAC